MKKNKIIVFISTLSFSLFCNNIHENDLDQSICRRVQTNFASHKEDKLIEELAEKFNVDENQVYFNSSGVYIKQNAFFVSESGIFINPKTPLTTTTGDDPVYIHLKHCYYHYEIKG